MPKLRDGWRAVELLGARPAPRAEWQLHARLDFDVIARYLVPHEARLSRHYPCPRCGRAFVAESLDDGKAVAFPDEDDGHRCPEVELTHEDLAEWVCDAAALRAAIAGALALDGAAAVVDAAGGVVLLGTRVVDGERVPVLLCIQATSPLYCAAANAWLARRIGAGVFLTARACPPLLPIFDGKPDVVGSLEDLVVFDGDGGCRSEKAFDRMVRRVAEAGARGVGREARRPTGGVPPVARYVIQRGVNTWRVIFDGVELPGLGKDRGMFFVAYLVGHAGGDPIHALELEAKVSRYYRKDCGLTEIVDPDRDEPVAVDAEAVMVERDLNMDNERLAELLRQEERKSLAIVENPKASPVAKAEALKNVEAIRLCRLNRFGKNSSPANDAARRVRTAVDRLIDVLGEMTPSDAKQAKAVVAFAVYVRMHVREASAALWPKAGLRSRKAKWQPGHFRCEQVEGIDWVVM